MSTTDSLTQRLRRAIDRALTFSDDVVDDRAMPFDDLKMRDRALAAFDTELRLFTPSPTPPVETLSEEALSKIETRLMRITGAQLDNGHHPVPWEQAVALCQSLRAAWGERDELRASETFWQAEALLEHFCSEHAKNTRQAGHYCTICAKPFVMTVPQGERPPKYKDLIAENAALREQLAEAHKWIDRKNAAIETWQQQANTWRY